MTPTQRRSRSNGGGERSRVSRMTAPVRDWLSPRMAASSPKRGRLMKPPLQNFQESRGAITVPNPTVTAKAATQRRAAAHSRLSMRKRMKAPGTSLMPAARPINIPRYRAGTTKQSTTTMATRTMLICPRRMFRANGSIVRPASATKPADAKLMRRIRRTHRHSADVTRGSSQHDLDVLTFTMFTPRAAPLETHAITAAESLEARPAVGALSARLRRREALGPLAGLDPVGPRRVSNRRRQPRGRECALRGGSGPVPLHVPALRGDSDVASRTHGSSRGDRRHGDVVPRCVRADLCHHDQQPQDRPPPRVVPSPGGDHPSARLSNLRAWTGQPRPYGPGHGRLPDLATPVSWSWGGPCRRDQDRPGHFRSLLRPASRLEGRRTKLPNLCCDSPGQRYRRAPRNS